MKAAKLFGPRDTRVVETADPSPQAGEVLVRVRAVAICASDIEMYRSGCASGGVCPEGPIIQGHEFSGEVVAVGPQAQAPPIGSRVAVDPSWHCGTCDVCQQGLYNLCPQVVFPSFPPRDGAMAEYIACPDFSVAVLPDSISDIEGALTEPLGVGIHAARLAELSGEETVAILGAGMIGISTLMAVRLHGIETIVIAEPVAARRDFARQTGAQVTAQSAAQLAEAGMKPEVVFECSGDDAAFGEALNLVRPNGHVIVVGIPSTTKLYFDPDQVRRNQTTVIFSRRSLDTLERSVELLATGQVDFGSVPVRTFSLDQAPQAFELAAQQLGPELRLVVLP
ncbi:MAG: alcohol dehydrogenase catalytic domain-containing protein [Armatimonadetes bacterium]|nr:alcohol dehydrogenase catalytic domain-containing protein [Armatimonadota bacterium]